MTSEAPKASPTRAKISFKSKRRCIMLGLYKFDQPVSISELSAAINQLVKAEMESKSLVAPQKDDSCYVSPWLLQTSTESLLSDTVVRSCLSNYRGSKWANGLILECKEPGAAKTGSPGRPSETRWLLSKEGREYTELYFLTPTFHSSEDATEHLRKFLRLRFRHHFDEEVDGVWIAPDQLVPMLELFRGCRATFGSGCWRHTAGRAAEYARVMAIVRRGSEDDLYAHPGLANMCEERSRAIVRHHPLRCELLYHSDHNACCRPSHLCWGSADANMKDIKRRKAIQSETGLHDKWKELLAVFDRRLQQLQLQRAVDLVELTEDEQREAKDASSPVPSNSAASPTSSSSPLLEDDEEDDTDGVELTLLPPPPLPPQGVPSDQLSVSRPSRRSPSPNNSSIASATATSTTTSTSSTPRRERGRGRGHAPHQARRDAGSSHIPPPPPPPPPPLSDIYSSFPFAPT